MSIVTDDIIESAMIDGAHRRAPAAPRDLPRAVHFFRQAARQNDADAQYALGLAYRHGRGVPKDHAAGFKWLLKAARQGDADARHNLQLLRQGTAA